MVTNLIHLIRLLRFILTKTRIRVTDKVIELYHPELYLRWDNDKLRVKSNSVLVSDHSYIFQNGFKTIDNPNIKTDDFLENDLQYSKISQSQRSYQEKEVTYF